MVENKDLAGACVRSATELDNRHNLLRRFPSADRQKIIGLCYAKHADESRRALSGTRGNALPCVDRGLACLECQDQVTAQGDAQQLRAEHESPVTEGHAP